MSAELATAKTPFRTLYRLTKVNPDQFSHNQVSTVIIVTKTWRTLLDSVKSQKMSLTTRGLPKIDQQPFVGSNGRRHMSQLVQNNHVQVKDSLVAVKC